MKLKTSVTKSFFLFNHIVLILFMSHLAASKAVDTIYAFVPLIIASLFFIDITYMISCNINENKIISLFCGLLALDGWYLLFSVEILPASDLFFRLSGPLMIYLSVRFLFIFLFQGYGYTFKKTTDILLLVACVGAVIGVFLSKRAYACLYGLQFLLSFFCFLYITVYHWKRAVFVIRNEKRPVILSFAITAAAFIIYYVLTTDIRNHLGNFGIYLPVLLFFMSVHGIVLKEHDGFPLSAIFSRRQGVLLLFTGFSLSGLVTFLLNAGFIVFMIAVNTLSALIFLCNILLGINFRQKARSMINDSSYSFALERLRHEELLKTEFSNFLHDDILQDLLSVKNMMGKSYRPEIQDLICDALDGLNTRIRSQMQDYHPVILKSMTIKENYEQLIESISAAFPQRSITILFDCSESVFIAVPYDTLVYRLIKELLTNVYKHSDGDFARIILEVKKDLIKLSICDNGSQNDLPDLQIAGSAHKGLFSLKEQIEWAGGTICILPHAPHGIHIEIEIPMKGDVSYQYFIS